MDKLIEAIGKTLAKLGLDEDTIKAATEEIVAEASGEEVPPSDDNPPVEPSQEDVEQSVPEASAGPQDEVPSEEPNPSDTVPPVEENGEVPPVEEPTPELPPEEPAPVPPVPAFDPTELLAKIDELAKANQGLLSRVDSLEQALKNAGVVDESSQSQVGDDSPSVPGEPSDSDIFNEQLKFMNGRKQF